MWGEFGIDIDDSLRIDGVGYAGVAKRAAAVCADYGSPVFVFYFDMRCGFQAVGCVCEPVVLNPAVVVVDESLSGGKDFVPVEGQGCHHAICVVE